MRDALSFDTSLMTEDMVLEGLLRVDLARRAGVSDMTVTRFLRGERQTARTAKKLAEALGYSVRRYLITSTTVTAEVTANTPAA